VKEDILQAPAGRLLQLFSINSEFANEWNLFKQQPIMRSAV
jgi:hypothetical protein